MSTKFYLEHLDVKKYGGTYSIKYPSPIDGVQRRVPQNLTGPLASREDAIAWAKANLHLHLERELALAKRRKWHSSSEMVRLVSQYEAYKRKQAPRSWQQEISVLRNFTLPYFVSVDANPNTWHLEHQRFKSWLLDEAATNKGGKLSVSSANKAINSLNKFSEWLRDQARVLDWERFRPLAAYPASMQNRKGAEDLVDEVEFNMVVAHLEPLWADMARVQYRTGMRVNEVLGLSLASLTNSTPEETMKAFTAIGEHPVGSIYLDSQPRDPYITRGEGGEIPRKPLKWRKEISPKSARTIPISQRECWNILARRFAEQRELYRKLAYGPKKESYLLFDGSQRNTYLAGVKEAYKKVGLRWKGTHAFRHTRATHLTMLGLSEKMQEVVMGHKGMAQQRYIHIVEVLNRRTQEALDLNSIMEI